MIYSAIAIALTIACSNGVWANTIATTLPTTTQYTSPPPQVCYAYGVSIDVGERYEEKNVDEETCRVYECDIPPYPNSYSECYDSTIDKCVNMYSTQLTDTWIRVCEPNYHPNGEPGWFSQVCGYIMPTTPYPTTQPTPPALPKGCVVDGVYYYIGDITNSDGCICDYSGVVCP